MALQINLPDTNVGLPAPEAYARIVGMNIDILGDKLQVAVNVYANKAARDTGKAPVGGGVFETKLSDAASPVLDENNAGIRAACYAWLKSQPTFAGSQDV